MNEDTHPALSDEPLVVAGVRFQSRLFVGTGKYASFQETRDALELSGTDCVTVAVRRVNLDPKKGESLLDYIDRERYQILPNTAGCFDAESAVRTARLAREILGTNLVKLEVLGDKRTLLPDPIGTLEATRELVADGFDVFVYTSDDARLCVALEEAGAAAVMPAGSPIGSGQGILNPNAIRIVR
ncbi:MAG: thiazole synthase, partial [Planctomycetota bacterium]